MAPLLLKPTLGQKTLPSFLAVCLPRLPTSAFYSLFPSLFLPLYLSFIFFSRSFFLIDHALVIHMDFVFDETKLAVPIITLSIMNKFFQNITGWTLLLLFRAWKIIYLVFIVMRLNNVTWSFHTSNYSKYHRYVPRTWIRAESDYKSPEIFLSRHGASIQWESFVCAIVNCKIYIMKR